MTVPPFPTPLGRGSLRHRLLRRMVLLITVVCVGLSAVTLLTTREALLRSVDRQLDAAFSRQDRRGPDDGPDRLQLPPGQSEGTVVMVVQGGVAQAVILSDLGGQGIGVAPLAGAAAEALLGIPVDGRRVTLTLPGYGSYRALAMPTGTGVRVVALPLRELNHALEEMLEFALIVTVITLVGGALVVRTLLMRTLEPLNRLAATAHQVSGLELSRGEVELPVRVSPEDADPATEVGRVGHALNHMLSKVEDALTARQASETRVRQFVADASHELRNPLAAIRGYAEVSRLQGVELPPDTSHAIERVQAEAVRMSRLVDDLLLLARLDSRPDLTLDDVDVTEIVLNATSDAQAAHPDYDWGVDVPEGPVLARADRHRLHQVLANLLANAGRHTPPGTEVTTAVHLDGSEVAITVTDNGPGIPPSLAHQVFDRFTRGDAARSRSGASKDSTGLGLAIVAAVMEAHGGSAQVESHPGHTVFTVRVPRCGAARPT